MKILSKPKLKIPDYIAIIFILFGIGRIAWEGYNLILLILSIVWLLSVFPWLTKLTFLKKKNCVSFILFFFLYMFFLIVSDDIKTGLSYGGTYAIYIVLFLMNDYYSSEGKELRLKKIVIVSLIWIGIMCVCAIRYYSYHPGAARLYATHRSNLDGYMIGGGYQLGYISAMLLPVCVEYLLRKKMNPAFILLCLLMIVLIAKTSSMIIILVAILGCVVEYISFNKDKNRTFAFSAFGGILLILFLIRKSIGQFLINIAAGRKVTNISNMNNAVFVRMTEIGMLLKGINIDSSSATGLRMQNYLRPLEEIVSNPFLGGILKYGVSPESGIFNDSAIITAFSSWGIPMGCLFLYPFLYSFKTYKNYKGAIVAVILILLLNPSIGFSVVYGACFLLPAFNKIYEVETIK